MEFRCHLSGANSTITTATVAYHPCHIHLVDQIELQYVFYSLFYQNCWTNFPQDSSSIMADWQWKKWPPLNRQPTSRIKLMYHICLIQQYAISVSTLLHQTWHNVVFCWYDKKAGMGSISHARSSTIKWPQMSSMPSVVFILQHICLSHLHIKYVDLFTSYGTCYIGCFGNMRDTCTLHRRVKVPFR